MTSSGPPRPPPIARWRKFGTAAAMFGTSALVARHAHGFDAEILMCSAVLAAAGIGMTRRSMTVQILSRAVTALVFMPVALFALTQARHMTPELMAILLATGSSLALSWPMLHTAEARQQFHPNAFRHWFLAGATTTAATGLVSAAVALEAATRDGHPLGLALSFGALSLSLLASAVGVVRMRGWGVVLGAATSFVLMAMAPFMEGPVAFVLMLAAAPALLMQLLPVLVARTGIAAPPMTHVRIADPARVRVATDAELAMVDEDTAAAATAHAMRP